MSSPVRRRWISALLGGIVLPFDPLLGMVMLLVSLWQPKRAPLKNGATER